MTTVVAQPYSTAGNGGRKLVRLSNGWEVAVTKATDYFYFYVDKKDGYGFIPLCHIYNSGLDNNDIAIVAKGTDIHAIYGWTTSTIRYAKFNALTVPNTNQYDTTVRLAYTETALGNVSLAINPQGTELHATWSSKNSTYPNSFNIRYAKATIADGSVTWGAAEQISFINSTGLDWKNPSIGVDSAGIPKILVEYANTTNNYIAVFTKNFTTKEIASATVKADWGNKIVYNGGAYLQNNPSSAVGTDDAIHVAWHGYDSAEPSRQNLRYSKSIDGGVTWTSMQKLTTGNIYHAIYPSITTDKNGAIVILFHGDDASNTYHDIKQISNIDGVWGAVTKLTNSTTDSIAHPSTLYDVTFSGAFGTTPPTIYMDLQADSVEYIGTYTVNNAPTITLNTTNNQTLYENDILTIDGSAIDTDADQSVTLYYQINNDARKVLATNLSQISIPFNKQLTFKNGKLYDGETAISSTLTDGVAHTLKVWAQDSNGAESTVATGSFYVVPNRAPSLTINEVVPSGNINSDKFSISGSAGDPDANANVKVTYRINVNNSVEVYNGPGGAFTFEVSLGQLVVGQNTIVIEVVDNYGAKYSKTIKLNKNEVKTPLLKSTARYKIEPPSGSTKGVLLWIQRSVNLQIDAKISMGLVGEPENFVAMDYDKDVNGNPDNVAPIPNTDLVEAEYYYEATGPKDNIILQIEMTRSSLEVSDVITLISGVLE